MTYNIHPIFVHFPIALLFIYSVIKIIPFKKWIPSIAWRDIERVLLVLGVLGAFIASMTGEIAENLVNPNHKLVETHSMFAGVSTWIYLLLLIGEIFAILNTSFISILEKIKLTKVGIFLEKFLCNPIFSKVLSFVGLVTLSITGILGGVMVYGVTADPLAPFLLKLFGISL